MKTILTLLAIIITGAAMGQQKGTGQVKIDSTIKTAQSNVSMQQSQTYFLLGALQDYQLLYKCLASPGDVTPNELRSVIQWIDKGAKPLPGDTTKKKTP